MEKTHTSLYKLERETRERDERERKKERKKISSASVRLRAVKPSYYS